MPLAIHPWSLLLSFFCFSVALAGPQSLVFLSPYISSFIPTCAQLCFEEFINDSFPTSVCSNQQDLSCLCTSKSRTGFTLGEGALQCLAQDCRDESDLDLALAYEICSGVPNAVSETHRIITAPIQPSTTTTCNSPSTTTSTKLFFSTIPSIHTIGASTSSSSMSLPTSLITASGTPAPPNPTSWNPSVQTYTTMRTQMHSSSSTVTASAATSSVVAATASSLSSGQISGIVVGSVAAGALAFGLLFFFTCYRMRRKRRRDSDTSFGGTGVVEARPTVPYHSDPVADLKRRGPPADRATAKAQRVLGLPNRDNETRWSLWRRTSPSSTSNASLHLGFPKPPSAPFIGSHEHSPTSAVSYRTTSRLLPEKPNYSMPTSPSRSYSARRRVPEYGGNEQQEDLYDATARPSPLRPRRTSQRLRLPNQGPSDFRFPPQPQNLVDPFVDASTDPRARMERRRAAKEALPRIITPAIHASSNNSWSPRLNPTIHPPPPVLNPNRPAQAPKQAHFNLQPVSRAISPSLYSSRPSYASSNPHSSNFSHPNRDSQYPPRGSSYQPYQPVQNFPPRPASHSRKSAGKRPLTHLTTASDTEFEESDIDDSNDAPIPDSALSPVVESPLNVRRPPKQSNRSIDAIPPSRSPIADIRYPSIPGSAVSSFSRRQERLSPPLSPTPKPQQQRRPNPRIPLPIRITEPLSQGDPRPSNPIDRSVPSKPTIRIVPSQREPHPQQPHGEAALNEMDGTNDSLPHGAVRRSEHIISEATPQIRPGGGSSGAETLRRTAKHRILLNQDIDRLDRNSGGAGRW